MSDSSDTTPGFSGDVYNPDRLIAGEGVRTLPVTIVSGQNVARGAVLGRITASGKYALSAAAAGDGSEVPRAVVAVDVDASAADKEGQVIVFGELNAAALIFGAGHDADSVREDLRSVGIFLKRPLAGQTS